jgi:hypothetical protein
MEQALDLKRGLQGRLPLVHALLALGSCYQQLGQLEGASSLLDEALCLATELESPVLPGRRRHGQDAPFVVHAAPAGGPCRVGV